MSYLRVEENTFKNWEANKFLWRYLKGCRCAHSNSGLKMILSRIEKSINFYEDTWKDVDTLTLSQAGENLDKFSSVNMVISL